MNVLITGAAGFIGSNLVGRLANHFELTLVMREFIAPSEVRSNTIYVDMSHSRWTNRLPSDVTPHTVIHLAQATNYGLGIKSARDIIQINVAAATELLDWCRNKGVRRVIIASSGNVYGDRYRSPLKEEFECNPRGIYAHSKHFSELISREYSSYFDVLILRFFGVYGKHQQRGLIQTIVNKVIEKQKIIIASGAGLIINPIYIDDCVKYLEAFLRVWPATDTMNIAGGEIVSLKEVATQVGEIIGMAPVFECSDEPYQWLVGDTARLNQHTTIENPTTIRNGLQYIIQTKTAKN